MLIFRKILLTYYMDGPNTISPVSNSRKQFYVTSSSHILGHEGKGAIFQKKANQDRKRVKMHKIYKKLGNLLAFLKKGTLMGANIAHMKGLQ